MQYCSGDYSWQPAPGGRYSRLAQPNITEKPAGVSNRFWQSLVCAADSKRMPSQQEEFYAWLGEDLSSKYGETFRVIGLDSLRLLELKTDAQLEQVVCECFPRMYDGGEYYSEEQAVDRGVFESKLFAWVRNAREEEAQRRSYVPPSPLPLPEVMEDGWGMVRKKDRVLRSDVLVDGSSRVTLNRATNMGDVYAEVKRKMRAADESRRARSVSGIVDIVDAASETRCRGGRNANGSPGDSEESQIAPFSAANSSSRVNTHPNPYHIPSPPRLASGRTHPNSRYPLHVQYAFWAWLDNDLASKYGETLVAHNVDSLTVLGLKSDAQLKQLFDDCVAQYTVDTSRAEGDLRLAPPSQSIENPFPTDRVLETKVMQWVWDARERDAERRSYVLPERKPMPSAAPPMPPRFDELPMEGPTSFLNKCLDESDKSASNSRRRGEKNPSSPDNNNTEPHVSLGQSSVLHRGIASAHASPVKEMPPPVAVTSQHAPEVQAAFWDWLGADLAEEGPCGEVLRELGCDSLEVLASLAAAGKVDDIVDSCLPAESSVGGRLWYRVLLANKLEGLARGGGSLGPFRASSTPLSAESVHAAPYHCRTITPTPSATHSSNVVSTSPRPSNSVGPRPSNSASLRPSNVASTSPRPSTAAGDSDSTVTGYNGTGAKTPVSSRHGSPEPKQAPIYVPEKVVTNNLSSENNNNNGGFQSQEWSWSNGSVG